MKKNTSGFSVVMVLVVIVALAAVAGAGYYVWNKNQKDTEVSVVTTPSNVQVEKNTDEQMATYTKTTVPASYKKYTNSELGFSFSYPENWLTNNLSSDAKSNGVIVCVVSPQQSIASKEFAAKQIQSEGLPDVDLCVNHWEDINNELARGGSWIDMKENYANLEELLKDPNSFKQFISKITVNERTAYEVVVGGLGENYAVMLETEKGVFEFSFANVNSDKATTESTGLTPEILNNIISSIEFN